MNKFRYLLPILFAVVLTAFSISDSSTAKEERIKSERLEASAALILAADASDESVNVLDLRGTTCYPQLDNLVSCGAPDTLAVLVFTKSDAPIQDVMINLEMDEGLQFAGFAEIGTPDGMGMSVLDSLNVTNSESPSFMLSELSQASGGVVLLFGIQAQCGHDFVADPPGINVNLTYGDCVDDLPLAPIDTEPLTPEVVFTGAAPSTTITDLNTEFCMTQNITQVTTDASTGEATLTISDFGFPDISLDNIIVDGNPVPASDIMIDANGLATIVLDGNANPSYFNGDGILDNGENSAVQFCFSLAACPPSGFVSPFNPNLSIAGTCNGILCGGNIDFEVATLAVNPIFRNSPDTEFTNVQEAAICDPVTGEPSQYIFDISTTGTRPEEIQGALYNLAFRIDECPGGALVPDSVQVFAGGSPTGALTTLPLSGSLFAFSADGRLTINLQALGQDFDGPGGLTDIDGDGSFDDVIGSDEVRIRVYLGPTSCSSGGGCGQPAFADDDGGEMETCQFTSITTLARGDCNTRNRNAVDAITPLAAPIASNSLSEYPDIGELGTAPRSYPGFNFGVVGNTSGGPVANTIPIVYDYTIDPDDFSQCPGGGIFSYQVTFIGDSLTAENMEMDEILIDGVPGMVTTTNMGVSTLFEIPLGNGAAGSHTISFDLSLDTFACGPALDHLLITRVVEECPTCLCSPIVRTCQTALVQVDLDDFPNCICDVTTITQTERLTFGYTDRSQTTQLTSADFPGDDNPQLDNVLPGDTIEIISELVVNNAGVWNNRTERLGFSIFPLQGGSTLVPNVLPRIDMGAARVQEAAVIRGATVFPMSNIQPVGNVRATYNGIKLGSAAWNASTEVTKAIHPAFADGTYTHSHANSGNDYQDGSLMRLYFWGEDRVAPGELNGIQALYDLIGGEFEVGDTIRFVTHVPIVKTPELVDGGGPSMGPLNVDQLIFRTTVDARDFIPGTTSITGNFIGGGSIFTGNNAATACIFQDTIQFQDPGIELESIIDYQDICAAEIRHNIVISNPLEAGWYNDPMEYRPIIGLEQLFSEFPEPYIYGGGATYELLGGPAGQTGYEPDSIASTDQIGNFHCATDRYGELYFVDAETKNGLRADDYDCLNDDTDISLSGGTFPLLGVGGDALLDPDTLQFIIPISRLCTDQAPETPVEGSILGSYPYLADYNIIANICNRDGNWVGMACSGRYWPWKRDSLNNPHRFASAATMIEQGAPVPSFALDATVLDMEIADTGGGETNTVTICPVGPGPITQGVYLIEIPSNVSFDGSTPALTQVSSTSTSTIYSTDLTNGTVNGTCFDFEIETSLIFCGPDEICSYALPCDADPDLVIAKDLDCLAKVCYSYRAGEPEIQAGFNFPTNPPPCATSDFEINFANTGSSYFTDVDPVLYLPVGFNPMLPFTVELTDAVGGVTSAVVGGMLDPALTGANGNAYTIDVALLAALLGRDGFEALENLSFMFSAEIACEFTSGTMPAALFRAEGDCDPFELFDRGQPINTVPPSEDSNFSIDTDRLELNCTDGGAEILITSLNSGKTASGPTRVCIVLPDGISLTESDLSVVAPTGYTPENFTSEPVGTSGDTKISFDGPSDVAVGGFFCVGVSFEIDSDLDCGILEVGFEIKSVTEVPCMIPPDAPTCSTQAIVASEILPFEIVPAASVGEATLTAACNADPTMTDLEFELALESIGEAFNGNIDVELFFDLDKNGMVDSYDTSLGTTSAAASIPTSGEGTVAGAITVSGDAACAIIAKLSIPGCSCSMLEIPFPEIEPSFLAALGESVAVCPGEPLVIEDICGDLEMKFIPAAAGSVVIDDAAGTATVMLNPGFGEDAAVTLMTTFSIGSCVDQVFMTSFRSVGDFDFGPFTIMSCNDQTTQADLNIPVDLQEDIEVTITPSTFLDDPNSFEPSFINPTANQSYVVEFSLNGQCMTSTTLDLIVTERSEITVTTDFDMCDTIFSLEGIVDIDPPVPATWSTDGDGSFEGGTDVATALNYAPGPMDIDAGMVTLLIETMEPQPCGNSFQRVMIDIVVDTIAPTITCPNDICVPNDPDWCGANFNLPIIPIEDNCTMADSNFVIEYNIDMAGWTDVSPNNQFFPNDTTSIGIRVTDEAGNMDSCFFNFIVKEKQAPEAICTDLVINLGDTDDCSATVTAEQLGGLSTDECMLDMLLVGLDTMPGSLADEFEITGLVSPVDTTIQFVIVAIDTSGNKDECTSSVRVLCGVPPAPAIGLAKRAAKVWLQDDGCALVEYEFNIENLGNVSLENITLVDTELNTNYTAACESVIIKEMTSDDFIVNANYADALSTGNLLDPTANSQLAINDKGAVLVLIEACGCGDASIDNAATTTAEDPNGTEVTDDSTDGSESDPNGDGTPEEEITTTVDLTQSPIIGLAKRSTDVDLLPNGCAEVTYEFNIVNSGNVQLTEISLIDDLNAAFVTNGDCASFTIDEITSDDFIVNGAFDGLTGSDMLLGLDTLSPGDKGAVLLTVEACGCGAVDIMNAATVDADAPDGTEVSDDSTDGSDPDPEGNGPGDNAIPTITSLGQNPSIGGAKRVADATLNPDGSFVVLYELNIENFGDVNIADLQAIDDLSMTFSAPCAIQNVVITSDDFTVNPNYSIGADWNLLTEADTLLIDDKGAILIEVTVADCAGVGPFMNEAMVSGTAPDGTGVSDDTVNGSEPDGNGDGDPTDEDSPTPFTLEEEAVIGVAKYVKNGPINNGDGTYSISFGIRIENLGNVNIQELSLTDDLATAFTGCDYSVSGVSSEEFAVNLSFNGSDISELLADDQELKSWDEGEVCVNIIFGPCDNLGPFMNSATAMGTTPAGDPVMDVSQSGSNPDPDGDGETDDNDEGTPFEFEETGLLGLAKRIVTSQENPDGSVDITYEFNVENFGDVAIENLQVADNLNAVFAPCDVALTAITSDDFIVDPTFTMGGNANMLLGDDILEVGDKGAILIEINVSTCAGNTGPFMNQATATGATPSGEPVSDLSDNGSDPDGGDGDDDPTDESDMTTIEFNFQSFIGLAKDLEGIMLPGDGSAIVDIRFIIQNYGTTDLGQIVLTDDVITQFSPCDAEIVLFNASPGFSVNPNYDGGTVSAEILTASDNNSLLAGQSGFVFVRYRFTNCGDDDLCFCNQGFVTAVDPLGTIAFDDLSQSGTNPDPDGDLDPTNNNECTEVKFGFNPAIGIAKRVSEGPTSDGMGCFDLTYEIRVENLGDQEINGVQVVDDLSATFLLADSWNVIGVESEEFMIDPGYDGIMNQSLLLGNDTLGVSTSGDEGAIYVKVNVCPGEDLGPYNNQAFVNGTAADGTPLDDASQDGSNPDPDFEDDATDNNDPTPISFEFNPLLGGAKRVADATLNPDGSFVVLYEINIENFGDVSIADIQAVDNLAMTFAAPCAIENIVLTSDDFTVNPLYDGVAVTGLLTGADTLQVNDKGAILLEVTVAACASVGPFNNSATVSGTSPDGMILEDDTVNGSEPDGDGDGDPTDEDSVTPFTLEEDAVLGVAKYVKNGPINNGDGTFSLSFGIRLENLGNVNIEELSLTDNLVTAFAGCDYEVTGVSSEEFAVNLAYNGDADTELLDQSAPGQELKSWDEGEICINIIFGPCANAGPFMNSATAMGTTPAGDPVQDVSQNGSNPDPDGDGETDDNDEPTGPITFPSTPSIGGAKRVADAVLQPDGSFVVIYEINIENFGDVSLADIQAVDDLGMTFIVPCAIDNLVVTSDDFTVNPLYDGVTVTNLLTGSDTLQINDKGAILIEVTVAECASVGPFNNSATVSGTGPDGTEVEDDTVNGSEPDGDGDGDPTDEDSVTPFTLEEDAVLGVAKYVKNGPINNGDGTFSLSFGIRLENLGNVNIEELSLTDNLVTAFADCDYEVTGVSSEEFAVNLAYNGDADTELLDQSAPGQELKSWDEGEICINIIFGPCANAGSFMNSATAMGTTPAGDPVEDVSQNGSNPDPDGDGETDDNDEPTGPIIFPTNPDMGIAKRVVTSALDDDGCTEIVYEFNIENLGDVILSNLQVTDDLNEAGFDDCGSFTTSLTSDEFAVNPAYNGDDITTMLIGTDNVVVDDIGSILLTVNACGCPSGTMITNSATASAASPSGAMIEDNSTDGSVADPDGNGEDGTDAEESTTDLTLMANPQIGLAKRAAKVWLQDDGCALIEYEFNIENSGDVIIDNLELTDDLATAFAGCAGDAFVKEITSDDFIVNADYAGVFSGDNMLAIGQSIASGDKGAVLVLVEACGCGNTTINNMASISGEAPDGSDVNDDSTPGSDPDPNDDGEPDESDMTMTDLTQSAIIGIAKRASDVDLLPSGCSEVTYELNIQNYGNVQLSGITVMDDLTTAFAGCSSFRVDEITSDDFIVDPAYAGVAMTNMLTGVDTLNPGDKGAILLTIEACGCGNTTITNQATAGGTAPDNSVVSDESDSGSDPDEDGDGPGNNNDMTMTNLGQDASIGTSKRMVELMNNSDGSSTVTFEFNIQNYGNVDLNSIQLVDDLGSVFGAPCSVRVLSMTSDDFKINTGYDGVTDVNILTGNDLLTVSNKGAVLLTINVANCGANTGPYNNQATASGVAPDGSDVDDLSTNGSDPDALGDGDPSDDPEDSIPTTIGFEFISDIGLAKNAVAVTNNADGSSIVIYEFNVENFGNQIIRDIQVADNLLIPFGTCPSVEVLELTSDDFTVNTTDPYDGIGLNNLLIGGDSLGVGDQGAILLTIRVDCGGDIGPFNNTATVTGTAADGTGLSDISQNGSDPDPNNDGSPADNNVFTPVNFGFTSGIGVSKRVSQGPFLNDDGCFDLVYEVRVENFGDVDLADIQVLEDLAATFAGAEGFTVTGVESEEFTVNTDFNGAGDIMLLNGTDTLIAVPGGDEGAIYIYLNVCPGANVGPYLNTVIASGTPPSGMVISDESADGSDPDPNNDGNPSDDPEDSMATPVTLEFAPAIGLSKRLASIEMITDDCARVTYEFNIENFGNTDLDELQLTDDLATAFGGCSEDVSIFQITSDDFTVNGNYADAFTTGNLLTGGDDLPVGDIGAVLLTVDACTCGTSVVTNSAMIESLDPAGDPVNDVSADGSDPDADGDGDPSNDSDPTVHTIVCTVAIICPDVHDPVNVQNDLEECGAVVNFPDARIESNCTNIDEMDIQFMLNAADGTLPVTDPANGDATVAYDIWITGQAGGLNYPVDTITVTYRINPADLPTGITAPIQNPGMCSFDVIVRDEQCPVFVTTMPEDTILYDCIIPDPFIVNPVWHLRDNCEDPEDIVVDFVEIKFDSICPNTYTLKRTWTISDEAGNACEHNHKLFVRDTTPPMITLPPDTLIQECSVDSMVVNCRLLFTPIDTIDSLVVIGTEWVLTQIVVKDTSEVCDTILTPVPLTAGIATATDGECTDIDDIIITFRDSIDLLCKGEKAGIVYRIWRAEDECGNVSTDIQEITILDPNPPILEVHPEVTVSLGTDGHVTLTRDDVVKRLFDACFTDVNDLIVKIEPGYFNCSDIGEHRVIVSVTDPCNNKTAYDEVIVKIIDNIAPTLNCPTGTDPIVINIDPSNCDASFSAITDILVGQDCDVVISTDPQLNAGIDLSTTSITVTATDASGNSSSCVVPVSIGLTQPINFSEALSCNDRVNVSLGGECWLELTPDFILEGSTALCNDLLCIDVTDENGVDHLNFFDETDIGKVFRVTVKDCNGSGNSCWSEVLLEEKQIPIVQWPVDTTLLCVEPTTPDYFKLGFPEVLNCEPEWSYDYEDVYREFDDCSSPRATIERRWIVSDDEGNVLRDTQIINIIPFSTKHVRFPENITIEDPIDCRQVDDTFFDIENGLIKPESVIHPDSTGRPNIFGLPLTTDKGLCLFSMGYEDKVLEICGGSFQILREWTLNDVCSGFEDGLNPISHTQVITIYDLKGPHVDDESKPLTVSINPWQCTFSNTLPLPEHVHKSCGAITFDAYVTGEGSGYIIVDGTFEGGDLAVTGVNIAEGIHWVTYVYLDGCANIEIFKYQLTVIDEVVPVAICQDQVNVSITGGPNGGSAKLFAENVDGGSHDAGCGPVTTCILRLVDFEAGQIDTTINGRLVFNAVNDCFIDGEFLDTILDKNGAIDSINRVPYVLCKDFLEFCCTDLGEQPVTLIATDDVGLWNHCWTNVNIEDKSSALLNCEPHTIDCTDDRDVDLWSPIGTNSLCGESLPLKYIDESDFLNGCGEGQIFRVWYLDQNDSGTADEGEISCNQVITVKNATIFDPYTIKWPKHFTGEIYAGVNVECGDEKEVEEFDAAGKSTGTRLVTKVLEREVSDISMGSVFSCSVGELSSAPVWCNTSCGLVGVSVEVDTVVASDACLKLIKRWTVIDWCYWEVNGGDVDDENDGLGDDFEAVEDWAQGVCAGCVENTSSDAVYFRYKEVDRDGYYTYDQVIKVVDDTAPSVEAADVVVNTSGGALSKDDDTSCTGTGTVIANASDLCDSTFVSSELLNWVIRYDNGTTVSTSATSGASVSIETQAGSPGDEHTVTFIVSDGCGNASTAISSVTFGDEKAPVPLCITGVSTAFMESDGSVAIWAKDFDLGSFDNCGAIDYSVVATDETPITPGSTDFGSQSNIEFTCDDLQTLYELDIWIWDTSGNGDFCTVSVLVGGECPNGESGSGSIISGTIATEVGDWIEGVTVTVASQELQEYPKSMLTEMNGEYAFYNNPLFADYQISSSKDYNYLNGVSTLDIVLIMKHILATDPFESPYNVIASDVNNDRSVSASDVVLLRKLILGLIDNLPNNESWRFVDKSYSFFNTSKPWPFVEIVNIEQMNRDMDQDIIGVKIGDVNGDVQPNSLTRSEIRTVGTIELRTQDQRYDSGEEVTVAFRSTDVSEVRGFQMTVEHSGLRYVGIEAGTMNLTSDHIGVHDSKLTLSYDGSGSVSSDDDDNVLFYLIFKAEESSSIASSLELTSSITRAEAYMGESLDQHNIGLIIDQSEIGEIILHQNDPNPFATSTKIRFELPESATATMVIFDMTGKELQRYEGQYDKGIHTLEMHNDELETAGLYYYQLSVDSKFIDSKKMMVIK